jgi:hypothetical protein
MNEVVEKCFWRGWMNVPQQNVGRVRARIMRALGVTTFQSFRDRLNGRVKLTSEEVEKIEEIFKDFGIIDVWGDVQ